MSDIFASDLEGRGQWLCTRRCAAAHARPSAVFLLHTCAKPREHGSLQRPSFQSRHIGLPSWVEATSRLVRAMAGGNFGVEFPLPLPLLFVFPFPLPLVWMRHCLAKVVTGGAKVRTLPRMREASVPQANSQNDSQCILEARYASPNVAPLLSSAIHSARVRDSAVVISSSGGASLPIGIALLLT